LREMGSHQQLLAQRGLYWKLYQLQYKDQEQDPRFGVERTEILGPETAAKIAGY
jgi:ATP-binding cassette subfamily B multidrug efflux pump